MKLHLFEYCTRVNIWEQIKKVKNWINILFLSKDNTSQKNFN